ncbi:BRO-N domain-containing protein [Streptomyces sp. 8N706]|uniref:BRO-N domain-containing protein n=1 Tax=Streptomyces sp. 8N706 TaxID=3457416 RepID=UPI003FD15155
MSEHGESSIGASAREAIDIGDFVYAATGARIRRLTMPGGRHWFPAADLARVLGYTDTPVAVFARQVPVEHAATLEELARTVDGSDTFLNLAGRGLRKSTTMVDLQGLITLVNGCAKPEAELFKRWVSEVVLMVQRDGSYALAESEVQPRPRWGTSRGLPFYAMPDAVIDMIAAVEERNARLDEELAAVRRDVVCPRRESVDAQLDLVRSMARIADSLERIAERMRARSAGPERERESGPRRPEVSAEAVLADWRTRCALTDEVLAVALHIVPLMVAWGQLSRTPESIAARTGLSADRVCDGLCVLLETGCIRQSGVTAEGTPVYVLGRPHRP